MKFFGLVPSLLIVFSIAPAFAQTCTKQCSDAYKFQLGLKDACYAGCSFQTQAYDTGDGKIWLPPVADFSKVIVVNPCSALGKQRSAEGLAPLYECPTTIGNSTNGLALPSVTSFDSGFVFSVPKGETPCDFWNSLGSKDSCPFPTGGPIPVDPCILGGKWGECPNPVGDFGYGAVIVPLLPE